MFVIHKSSRLPGITSYSGPTWDTAGIRALRKDTYTNKHEAEVHAAELAKYNPVGFSVSEVK